ncbi:MAG TPA: hypothetical protein VL400_15160 [Polyangiaceae bacterium]|nr:hypothetical protein [Polyangiaceae bacterium]
MRRALPLSSVIAGLGVVTLTSVGLVGCGGGAEEAFGGQPQTAIKAERLPDGSIDDKGKCEYKGRQDREVVETAGPGAVLPNVRRVFAIVGQGIDRQRVLVCREIDTNYDGVKDVVRRYNDKGESLFEEADTNFDGKVDTWLTFAKGRIAEEKLDRDFNGNPDEWKYYSGGRVTRAKRDTNKDGKPDVWEMYANDGKLERMGVDVDGDERVDRWDFDSDIRRAREVKERAEEDAASEKAEAERKAGEYKTADEDAQGDGVAGDKKTKKTDKKPAAKKPEDKKATDKKTDAKATDKPAP